MAKSRIIWAMVAIMPLIAHASTVTTLSNGFSLPEDIILIPAGFDSVGGNYFVTDASRNFAGSGAVYTLPVGGGAPTVFTSSNYFQPIGGVFLPSNYGSLAGDLLMTGRDINTALGDAIAMGPSGALTILAPAIGTNILADVKIAPAGFDTAGGDAVTANEEGNIYAVPPSGNQFVLPGGTLGIQPYGLSFAPGGFGAVGGDLLISSSTTGQVYALSSSGQLTQFTNIPLGPGQAGLRQMAFAPAGFGSYGGDLFVSVSGSNAGGGIAGSVDVVNGSGQVVAYLSEGTVGAPYDPRGIYFPNNQNVLIADADPSILSAQPSAFTSGSPVPEPGTAWFFLLGVSALWLVRHHVGRKCHCKGSRAACSAN